MHGFETLERMDFYLGFYCAQPFWVGRRIDIYDAAQAQCLRGIIPEVAVELTTEHIKAAICVNGLMLLRVEHLARTTPAIGDPTQFSQSALWMDEHLDYANAMQLCLESESIKHPDSYEAMATATRAKSVAKVGLLDGIASNISFERGRMQTAVMQDLSAWIAGDAQYPSPLEAAGWRVPHEVINLDAARCALEAFSIIARNQQQVRWLSYLLKAKTAYADNDYRMSFVLSWFVIESSVRWCWKAAHPEQKKPNMAVSRMIADLCVDGVISEKFKSRLEGLRVHRNALMHDPADTICQPDHCQDVGQAAIDLAVRDANIALVTAWESDVQF